MASGEGLNLFQQPTNDTSIVSRADTEYYPSDMMPDNNKESINNEVINKSETDFIDLISTEILADLQICDTTDNAALATTLTAQSMEFVIILDRLYSSRSHCKREI